MHFCSSSVTRPFFFFFGTTTTQSGRAGWEKVSDPESTCKLVWLRELISDKICSSTPPPTPKKRFAIIELLFRKNYPPILCKISNSSFTTMEGLSEEDIIHCYKALIEKLKNLDFWDATWFLIGKLLWKFLSVNSERGD